MFLKWILFGFFLSSLPSYSQEKEIPAELSKSEQSVWKVNYRDSFRGSGFFISPKLFMTNAHLVERSQIQNITLTHKDQTEILNVKKLLALDLKLDLALLEIKERFSSHLLFKEDPVDKKEELFFLGYPQKNFNILQKVGLLKIFSETEQYFPANSLKIKGASGGPVLDAQGRITGVLWGRLKNIALTIPQKTVQKFIEGESGVTCSNNEQTRDCFFKALAHLFEMAERGDPQAQHKAYSYNPKIEWLKSSAEKGSAIAQYDLAFAYHYGIRIPQNDKMTLYWLEQSAQSGFIPAQDDLAELYEKENQP